LQSLKYSPILTTRSGIVIAALRRFPRGMCRPFQMPFPNHSP